MGGLSNSFSEKEGAEPRAFHSELQTHNYILDFLLFFFLATSFATGNGFELA